MGFEYDESKYEDQELALAMYLVNQMIYTGNELLKKEKSLESLIGIVYHEEENINGAIMAVPEYFDPMESISYQKLAEYWIREYPDTYPVVIGISGIANDKEYAIMLMTGKGYSLISTHKLHRSILGNKSIGDQIQTLRAPDKDSWVCDIMSIFFHIISDSFKTRKLSSISNALLH